MLAFGRCKDSGLSRITFIDYDPKVVINELEDGLSESRHSYSEIVKKHGLIEPIASPNDVGNLLFSMELCFTEEVKSLLWIFN